MTRLDGCQGQSNHFTRYAPEKIEYGMNRYQNETRRLYGVLETHLKGHNYDYLVGGKCTIADIAHFGWIAAAGWAGVEIEDFPTLNAWLERMYSRPGVEKGRHVPKRHGMKELMQNKELMEKKANEAKAWIQAGMKQDAQRQK